MRQIQEVWEVVHKTGELTSKQVADVLQIPEANTSGHLAVLFSRGLVTREKTHYINAKGRRCVLYKYRTVGDTYSSGWELYAKKQAHEKRKAARAALAKQMDLFAVPAATAVAEPVVTPVINGHGATVAANLPIDIESMTVRDARAAYEKLKGFFGNT